MKAKFPVREGKIDRDGVKLHYEVYGQGEHTILFLVPWWPLLDSRCYKAQIPYFSEHFQCIVFDPRGNGKSDYPVDPESYGIQNFMDDALMVLDTIGVEKAILFGLSCAGTVCAGLAANHPERVEAVITVGTVSPLATPHKHRPPDGYLAHYENNKGWQKYNREYWLSNFPDFVQFFHHEMFNEPHSTKHIEDAVDWSGQTNLDVMVAVMEGPADAVQIVDADAYARIKCPFLVLHGDNDTVIPVEASQIVAERTHGEFVLLPDSGHAPHARIPAKINILARDFLAKHLGTWKPVAPPRQTVKRPKKVLYLSSPIGLGHVRRDLAITKELRKLYPDMEMDWLSQDPVTRFLAANNERIHPASAKLASETTHIESEAGEHDLNAFQAIRNMDEILVANFMLFQEVLEADRYDLVIADEAWEVDHFWHEHPELKKTQLAWLTDFVGFLPMPEGGAHEAFLSSDYNAEMIGHVEKNSGLRDRAIFVGNHNDIIPQSFGKNLPMMQDWIPKKFDFSGYILGQHPDTFGAKDALRNRLGYNEDEKICIVTVGGSGVGGALIRRILAAYPIAKQHIPELRMIIVLGPRLNEDQFNFPHGVEVRTFVPDLDQHLAACDLALVQGGLTTTMELAAAGTPFLYFPLKNHFEQNYHVAHRLNQYGAGRKMIFDEACPDRIAKAMVEELANPKNYKSVENNGANRAAHMLAELL